MLEHLVEKIRGAKVQRDPYPYFYIEKIFPDETYAELLDYFPTKEYLLPISTVSAGAYQQRLNLSLNPEGIAILPFFYALFWSRFTETLRSKACMEAILNVFHVEHRDFYLDLSLVSDFSDYAIGPHTDHPQKIVTLLFYCPRDETQKDLGTSIYTHPTLRCEGYKHHSFEGFRRVYRAPFMPNSCFGFLKSDCSFHGVESIGKQDLPRNSISYQLLTYDRPFR